MVACLSATEGGGFYAAIKRVEPFQGASAADEISIALDLPDQEERELWKAICSPGSWLGVIENSENG
jgi:hypothetical protein